LAAMLWEMIDVSVAELVRIVVWVGHRKMLCVMRLAP